MSNESTIDDIKLPNEINLQSPDDTTLFDDEEDIKIEFVNFEFSQTSKLRGAELELVIFNDTHCHHKISKKGKRNHKYRINIAHLDPRPFRRRVIAKKWAYATGGSLILTLLTAFGGFFEFGSRIHLSTVSGLFVVTVLLLLMTVHHSKNRVIFRSAHGKVKILELFNHNPDKASFRQFVDQFTRQIKSAREARNLPPSSVLAKELQELRRLKDERVIPQAAYERAKKILFKHEAYKSSE